MKDLLDRIADKAKGLTDVPMEKIEDASNALDAEARARYLQKIMEEDGVSYEEALRLTREEPKYSLGWKMCSPAIIFMLRMRGGADRFRQMLTPEELELFNNEVDGKINFKKAIKSEFRKQLRHKK